MNAYHTTPSPPPSSHGTPFNNIMSGGNGAGDTSDGPTALRAKASTLFERASRLSSNYDTHNYPQNFVTGQTEQPTRRTPAGPSEKYWSDFRSLHFSITRFIAALPPLPSNTTPTQMNVSGLADSQRPTMVLVHSLANVAMIQLHHTFSAKDISAHEKCLEAAVNVVSLISQLEEKEYELLDPIIGVSAFVSYCRSCFERLI